MKPLPSIVLDVLATLPEETRKVVLNTNGKGHWEVEAFARYVVDEDPVVGLTVAVPHDTSLT